MIDPDFKKYFRHELNSEIQQQRAWRKISNHIISGQISPESRVRIGPVWGALPVAVSLTMLLVGAVAARQVSQSVPGDTLYALKRTVEKAVDDARLRTAPDEAVKQRITVEMIVKRTQEITHLESKAEADGQVTPEEQAKINKVKAEVGVAAIKLSAVKSDNSLPSPQKLENISPQSSLLEAAEAEVVGEAVTQFLRSGVTDAKTDPALLSKLTEVVKTAQDEYKATSSAKTDAEPTLPNENDPQDTDSGKSDQSTPSGSSGSGGTSTISGEVDSGEIEIK